MVGFAESSGFILIQQILINTLAQGSNSCLLAIPIALLCRQRKFFDFSLAAVFVLSGFSSYMLKPLLQSSFFLWIVSGIFFGLLYAVLFEVCVFRILHKKRSGAGVQLLASLGLFISIQGILAICFGNESTILRSLQHENVFTCFDAKISLPQILQISFTLLVALSIGFLHYFSKMQAIRAVACDEELAMIVGIPITLVRIMTVALSGGLVGVSGVLVGLDVDLTPGSGLLPFFVALAAVIVGGMRNLWGAIAGSFALAFLSNFILLFASVHWQEPLVFLVLLVILIFRPRGIIGEINSDKG